MKALDPSADNIRAPERDAWCHNDKQSDLIVIETTSPADLHSADSKHSSENEHFEKIWM